MTFSIAARIPGGLLIGTAAHPPNTGLLVHHGRPGGHAVLKQSYSAFSEVPKPAGFRALRAAVTTREAREASRKALEVVRDAHIAVEDKKSWNSGQILLLGPEFFAAHTGPGCIDYASHIVEDDVVVAANFMRNRGIPEAMLNKWREEAAEAIHDPTDRMIAALRAGEKAGSDLRPLHSAALMFVPNDLTQQVLVRRVNYVDEDPIGGLRERQWVPVDHPTARRSDKNDVENEVWDLFNRGEYFKAENAVRKLVGEHYPFNGYAKEVLWKILLADNRPDEADQVKEEMKANPVHSESLRRVSVAEKRVSEIGFASVTGNGREFQLS